MLNVNINVTISSLFTRRLVLHVFYCYEATLNKLIITSFVPEAVYIAF